jgi:hypothetical protein
VEEKLKTRVILALGILCVILLIVAVNSCSGRLMQEQKWRKEMAQRLDSEDKAQKAQQEQSVLSEQLKKVKEDLGQKAKELEVASKKLMQEQLVNQNMKAELEKLSKLKEALEDDLKDALMRAGKTTAKQQPPPKK